AKIESKQLNISKEEFNLTELLKEIFHSFNEQVTNKGLKFKIIKGTDKDLIINSDNYRLKQILINLLDNAVKYTELGDIEVSYKIKSDNNIDNLEFYIKDTGIGISADRVNLIFQRFTKIEDDKKKLYRGAGLGLALTKSIVNLLGGSIWVESKINVGTTFHFTIPLESKSNYVKLNIEKPDQKLNYLWPGKTILIAEDEESNYNYIELLLNETQAEILHAENGNEAVKICKEKPIDLVLMDIKMPEMDGLEATQLIKQFRQDVPIIAQTSYALENDEKMSLEAGCDAYLTKPINKLMLLTTLNKYFRINI
ncbi:hybrid sensor histidine kinase/response regulator, partial [Bacteroidota bacterium]